MTNYESIGRVVGALILLAVAILFAALLILAANRAFVQIFAFGKARWRHLPEHLRRGLPRLYFAIAVPWTIWCGYQLLNAIDRYHYYSDRHVVEAFRLLLLVPIGAPIAFVLGAWVIAGFQKSASESEASKAPTTSPDPDHSSQ